MYEGDGALRNAKVTETDPSRRSESLEDRKRRSVCLFAQVHKTGCSRRSRSLEGREDERDLSFGKVADILSLRQGRETCCSGRSKGLDDPVT